MNQGPKLLIIPYLIHLDTIKRQNKSYQFYKSGANKTLLSPQAQKMKRKIITGMKVKGKTKSILFYKTHGKSQKK